MDLDGTLRCLHEGDIDSGMARLFADAAAQRRSVSSQDWREAVVPRARAHPVRELVHEDPLTRRVYEKPRGYPGDAVMLDYIYGRPHPEIEVPQGRGREILRFNLETPAARAVRDRRRRLAAAIDRAAAERLGARVLAVASGHLREVELSEALARRDVSELVAFDQDEQSLSLVASEYSQLPVTVRAGSVRDLLSGRACYRDYDLVYAAGLLDYLSQPTARRLVAVLFRSLRPGGRVLVANFAEGIPGAGYMEAFMDWFLVYRSECEMFDLLDEIPPSERAEVLLSSDAAQNILYLEVARA